jgi:hypothetical protein
VAALVLLVLALMAVLMVAEKLVIPVKVMQVVVFHLGRLVLAVTAVAVFLLL